MAKDFLKSDPIGDIEAQLNADFNQLIGKVHRSLSTKKRSPVWTGFFASSWKASTSAIRARDDIRKFKPWSQIKKANAFKSTPPNNPKVERRYPVTKTFNFKRPVFIGNRAKYAAIALEGGKVQSFVQGEIGKLIRETMKEKKGKLFVASGVTSGFGASLPGVRYTEF